MKSKTTVAKALKKSLVQERKQEAEQELVGKTFRELARQVVSEVDASLPSESVKQNRRLVVEAVKQYGFEYLPDDNETDRNVLGWTDEGFESFVNAPVLVNTSPHASFNTPTPNELKFECAHEVLRTLPDQGFLVNTTLTTNTLLETKYNPRQLLLDGETYQFVKGLNELGNRVCLRVDMKHVDSGAEVLLREFVKAYKLLQTVNTKFLASTATKGLGKLHQQGDRIKESALPSTVMKMTLGHGTPELRGFKAQNLAYASVMYRSRLLRKLYPSFKGRFMELPLDLMVRGLADQLGNVDFLREYQKKLRDVSVKYKQQGYGETGLNPYTLTYWSDGEPELQPTLLRYLNPQGMLEDLLTYDNTLVTQTEFDKRKVNGLPYTTECVSKGLREGYLFVKVPLLLYGMHLLGLDVMMGGPSQAGSYHQMLEAADKCGLERKTVYFNVGKAKLQAMPKPQQYSPSNVDGDGERRVWAKDMLSLHLCGKGRSFLEQALDTPYEQLRQE